MKNEAIEKIEIIDTAVTEFMWLEEIAGFRKLQLSNNDIKNYS